jgi:hypothetical protein
LLAIPGLGPVVAGGSHPARCNPEHFRRQPARPQCGLAEDRLENLRSRQPALWARRGSQRATALWQQRRNALGKRPASAGLFSPMKRLESTRNNRLRGGLSIITGRGTVRRRR